MKYYAVTDDPNELMHYGIKGMKWGVRNERRVLPRSKSYKKASAKLGTLMKSGIKKAEARWVSYNSPKAKEARFMKRATQKARNGTLKYGKLTDDQVRRITDRLALEQQARKLGSTENPRFGKRVRMAIGEGIVSGIGKGTSSYIDERIKGRGKTTSELKGKMRKLKYENRDDVQYYTAGNKALSKMYSKRYEKELEKRQEQYERRQEKAAARKQFVKQKIRNGAQDAYVSIKNRTKGVKKARNDSRKKRRTNNYINVGGYIS